MRRFARLYDELDASTATSDKLAALARYFAELADAAPADAAWAVYYQAGSDLNLYLDLLHEVTHVRQVREGRDVWDEAHPYHRRPTEIEGYAVAVSEARRLGLNEHEVLEHLSNPWMSPTGVTELLAGVDAYLLRRLCG